jgi:hypothetical protein
LKKIWRSPALMTWLALGVRLGGFAILLPLVLAKFTDAEVSVWLLFSAIASFQVIADFGFGPTFSREISYGFAGRSLVGLQEPLAMQSSPDPAAAENPNWAAIASATAAMLWLYRRIALATLVLLAVFGTWAVMLPIERIGQSHAAWLAWGAVALTTSAAIYGNAYVSFLVGANRIDLQKRWEALVGGISLIAQSMAVVLDWGLIGVVLVAQMALLAQMLVNRVLAIRIFGGRFGNVGHCEMNRIVLGSLLPVAWRTAIGTIMSIGISQGMAVAVANLLVAAEAASVQLALRVMQIISQFSQVPFYTRIPELNRLRAGGHTAQLAAAAAGAVRTSLWIYVLSAVMVDLGVRQLLTLISSQTFFPEKLFWLLLMLAVFAERFGAMHINLLLTSNKAIAHIANGVTGLIWIVGMLILYPVIDSLALPVSMLIAYVGFYAPYSVIHSHVSMPGIFLARFKVGIFVLPLILAIAWTTFQILVFK